MQLRILSKQILLTIAFLGLALSLALLLDFIPENPTRDNLALLIESAVDISNQEQVSTDSELSARLKIPSINVDAPVESVGLTSDGAMDIPKGPDEVAWFNQGPRPGEIGSAVVSGHYGWKNNTPAVFDNLHKLRVGDKIYIEDEKGDVITFVVRETRVYDKDAIVPEAFGSSDGKSHLNLITCTGDWNSSETSYSERLVVFTDKE